MLGTNNIFQVKITLWSWNVPRKARMAPEFLPKRFFTHITARAYLTMAVLAQIFGGFLPDRLGKALLNNLFTPVLHSFIKTSKTPIVFSTGWSHIYIPAVSIGTNQTRAKLTLIKQWQEFSGGWMSVLTASRTPDTFPNARIVKITHHAPPWESHESRQPGLDLWGYNERKRKLHQFRSISLVQAPQIIS